MSPGVLVSHRPRLPELKYALHLFVIFRPYSEVTQSVFTEASGAHRPRFGGAELMTGPAFSVSLPCVSRGVSDFLLTELDLISFS